MERKCSRLCTSALHKGKDNREKCEGPPLHHHCAFHGLTGEEILNPLHSLLKHLPTNLVPLDDSSFIDLNREIALFFPIQQSNMGL